jgi:hypothetical protein
MQAHVAVGNLGRVLGDLDAARIRLTLAVGIAALEHERGQPEAGLALAERGLALRRSVHGDDHPAVGADLGTLHNLGVLLVGSARTTEGMAVLRRAEALLRPDAGRSSPAGGRAFDAGHALTGVARGEPVNDGNERVGTDLRTATEWVLQLVDREQQQRDGAGQGGHENDMGGSLAYFKEIR